METSNLPLINYPLVKQHLESAQAALNTGRNVESLNHSALAFSELLQAYESTKRTHGRSPFFFGKDMTFMTGFHMDISDRKMKDFVDTVQESVTSMQEAVKIVCLGIEYPKYVKFKFLTPFVIMTFGGPQLQGKQNIKSTTANCQYCIDFVVENTLRLQESDFMLEDVFGTPE